MKIFQLKQDGVSEIRETKEGRKYFELEKTIQILIEKNLGELFTGLEFIKSEHAIENFRMDTVAFDNEKQSFVIIEYKNIENKSVIDQGFTYYDILQKNKADFVLLYNEVKKKSLSKNTVNWDEVRLIFISPYFNKYQVKAGNFRGLPIELYEIKKYEKGLITLDRLEERGKQVTPSKKSKRQRESTITEYSEEEYLDGKYDTQKPTDRIRTLYYALKNAILEIGKIEYKQKKKYAGFYSTQDGASICSVEVGKNKIKLVYSTTKKDLLPKTNFIQDVSEIGHWGVGNFRSEIKSFKDIEDVVRHIILVYEDKTGSKSLLRGFSIITADGRIEFA